METIIVVSCALLFCAAVEIIYLKIRVKELVKEQERSEALSSASKSALYLLVEDLSYRDKALLQCELESVKARISDLCLKRKDIEDLRALAECIEHVLQCK